MTLEGYRYLIFPTRWGYFGLLGTGRGLIRTSLPLASSSDAKAVLLSGLGQAIQDRAFFPELQRLIVAYFDGQAVDLAGLVPLVLDGLSPFTRAVLNSCSSITFGQVRTYRQVASTVGRPGAVRPAARALSNNPVPLIIPCHRVIRSDGLLGGFSAPGGIELKRRLLEHEARVLADRTQAWL